MAEIFNFYVQDNRSIQFPKNNLLEPIMQEDYNVATWRFRIPKTLNNIDMTSWAWWFVYVNAKGQKFSELLTLVDDIDEPDSFCAADYDIDYRITYNPGSFSFSLEAINAESGGAITGEWHTKTYSHKVDKTLQGNQAQWAETESDIISALIIEVQNKVRQLVGGATPEPKNLVADMEDPQKVYLYVGSEEDESNGYWYYHNGTRFVPGGLYASGITVDAVPTQGSTNAVQSGGVYSALAGKVDTEDANKKFNVLLKTEANDAVFDSTGLTLVNIGGWYGYNTGDIPYANGKYYANPLRAQNSASLTHVSFTDADGNTITLTDAGGNKLTQISGRRATSVLEINGTTVNDILYIDYSRFVSGTVLSITTYTLAETPAHIHVVRLYTDDHTEDGVCGITKDAWHEDYIPYGETNYTLSDCLSGMFDDKVDKISGKGLSTNDYTDAEKQKVTDATADLSAMTTATATDAGKALKAKTITDGKVTEWEFGGVSEDDSQGSIIEYEPINLAESVIFTTGALNIQTGQVGSESTYQTSDFIPLTDTWYYLKNVEKYCIYNDEKQYINRYGNNSPHPYRPRTGENSAYIRISVLNENIETALLCEMEHYYPDEAEVVHEQPRNLNISGDNFIPKLLNDIAHKDSARFADGANLFDIDAGYLYVAATGGVVINTKTTGDIHAGNQQTQAKLTFDVHYNNADIPVNGGIASTYYIPVESGKYLFSNYSFWNSAGYDSNKDFLAEVPFKNAFNGYLVPDGMAYVRLNFKAQTTPAAGFLQSLDDAKNIIVWQEETGVCTRPTLTLSKQIDGGFISPNYLDKVVPNMADSDFISAMKCLMVREINRREHAWRFGNFNTYVGSGTSGFYLIRKMLMDNGIDFCGFEEMSGRATDLGTFLESWQFAEGFVSPKNEQGKGTNALSIASRFPVQTWNTYTMTSVSSNKDCINARIRLPRFLDAYNPFRTMSMYVIHPAIGANQTNLANELLSIIASDESDYIVITSDTNSFSDTEEGKTFWRVLEAGGLRPVIPITTKTVTQDNLGKETDEYPEKQWRWHSIDQFFVSSNIDCVSYNVINTKDEYVGTMKNDTTTDGEYALSDHDFVYADLVFKDEVRSGLAQS